MGIPNLSGNCFTMLSDKASDMCRMWSYTASKARTSPSPVLGEARDDFIGVAATNSSPEPDAELRPARFAIRRNAARSQNQGLNERTERAGTMADARYTHRTSKSKKSAGGPTRSAWAANATYSLATTVIESPATQ